MLRQPAVGRAVKLGLLVLTLGLCAYGLFTERDAVIAALHEMSWPPVAGAVLAAIAGQGCMMLSWRVLLADLGSPLPLPAATRILFVAQLGKYVPGGVWAAAAQVEIARGHQVRRQQSATAAIVSLQVALATSLLVAAVALPLSSGHAARHYWWALALAVPVVLSLYPPLTTWAVNRLLRLARWPRLERQISLAGLARSFGWSVIGWSLFSLHAWLLVADVTHRGLAVLPLAAGAFALAWSVGFILVPFPGGVGPRELALVAALAPVMPAGAAIAVAVISRVALTTADLAWASVAFLLGWAARRARPAGPEPAGSPPGQRGHSAAGRPTMSRS